MSHLNLKELLKKREVLEEIDRHKWFESERVGYDIGFETASEDWFKKFASTWVSYHLPEHAKKNPAK